MAAINPPMDAQKEPQEQFAIMLCEHFTVFQHLQYQRGNWSPLAYLAGCGLFYGVELCITRGWDVCGWNHEKHIWNTYKGEPLVDTVLSTAMWNRKVSCIAVATLLLEHGTTDVIDILAENDCVIQCSPALEVQLLFREGGPEEDVTRLLLQHGSLVNSPYLKRGTHLAKAIVDAFRYPGRRDWLPQLLVEYGGCLDPVFPRPDGLIDSFVGEFAEYCLLQDDPELLHMLTKGTKIGRPVHDNSIVTTLLKVKFWDNSWKYKYIAWNVFCAAKGVISSSFNSKDKHHRRIIFLKSLGCDINALDCIIGYGEGEGDGFLHLEYCTALDCVSFLAQHENVSPGLVMQSAALMKTTEYCHMVSSLLIEHGAKVLPR
ncbi:hypothetical protein M422DRAFT_253191 [Sphaerobolus stellatus SS14]|uniref:Uncharacterized protein n=1 Tax=Sphaerobolus stellatus (strain SS14) TaxID=990650 RepID=A0A0C9UKI3_SPHS4|nr:hypothetical protein M422DRAFT_253191 [Sphaerobolus stellatus SS14]